MRILSARNYGTRTVIRVVHNPDDAELVHRIGDQLRDLNGYYLTDSAGENVLITSDDAPLDHTGENCHNCHFNWNVSEVVWDGDDCFYTNAGGNRVPKPPEMLFSELRIRLAVPPAVEEIPGLSGEVL